MRYSFLFTVLVGWALFAVDAATKKDDRTRYAGICGKSYPKLNGRGYNILQQIGKMSSRASLELSTSAQHKAMCWVIHHDKVSPGSVQMVQRYSLASLYFATQPAKWLDKTNWVSKESVCQWYGVTCDTWGHHITEIDLAFNQLNGILTREIGWLKHLRELRLTANDFQGVIPNSIELLQNLKVLQLNMNGFFGMIPREMGKLKNLRELHIYGNYLQGKVPSEIGDMASLEILDLNANFFTGQLPTAIGKMSNLKEIFFNDNNLIGSVPSDICKLKRVGALIADCRGSKPEVTCSCCTVCCSEQMDPKCKETKFYTKNKASKK